MGVRLINIWLLPVSFYDSLSFTTTTFIKDMRNLPRARCASAFTVSPVRECEAFFGAPIKKLVACAAPNRGTNSDTHRCSFFFQSNFPTGECVGAFISDSSNNHSYCNYVNTCWQIITDGK